MEVLVHKSGQRTINRGQITIVAYISGNRDLASILLRVVMAGVAVAR